MLHNSKIVSIIFFGSSKYSTIDAKALFDAFGISLIVTTLDQKDKKGNFIPNPVKQFALHHNIPVITTGKITEENIEEITSYNPDFLVSADIRLILPQKLLTVPKIAPLNVHHSLLPKFRGPAPVPFAILSGDKTTGVSIIEITKKVDAGDILSQQMYEMKPDDTTDSVLTELNKLGGSLVVKVIQQFDEYYKNRIQQNEKEASYSHFMTREDGYIDIEKIPTSSKLEIENWKLKIERAVRAYYPWPGVWFLTRMKDKEVRIKLLPSSEPRLNRGELAVPHTHGGTTNSGSYPFLLQIEGKKPMIYKDFINGYPQGREILQKLQILSY